MRYIEGHSNNMIGSPESDLWRNTLSKIPTIFERLLYLASLWDTKTAKFHHFGLALRYGRGRTNSLLRASYLELLRKWTECTEKDQQRQMSAYWAARASSLTGGERNGSTARTPNGFDAPPLPAPQKSAFSTSQP